MQRPFDKKTSNFDKKHYGLDPEITEAEFEEMGKAAGSMMASMLKRFWYLPVIGIILGGLGLWGIVAIIKFALS